MIESVTATNESESDLNIGIIWAAIGPIVPPVFCAIFHAPSFLTIFVTAGLPRRSIVASVADVASTITCVAIGVQSRNALLLPIATSIGRRRSS